MRSKLAIIALAAASIAGTTLVASAQTQPAPGASGQGEVGPGATKPTNMNSGGMTGTTGAGAGGMKRDPNAMPNSDATGQGTVGPGSNNNNGGMKPGTK
jgi:hypothetical protein